MYVVPDDLFGGKRRKDPKELVLARVYKLSDRQYLFLDAGDGKVLGGFEVRTRRLPKTAGANGSSAPGGR
ncbi:MAG: hypothetical protein KIS66_15795 [Fimbriimonadaceae bacterium]|nr:hypothetical protein [Fimbriimonadaceae bacterium]